MKNFKVIVVLVILSLFILASCGQQADVTGFTAEDEIIVDDSSSTDSDLVNLISINFNLKNNKLTWDDQLSDSEVEEDIRYHIYKEMPDINQYKRIEITEKNYYYLESVSLSDPREYIVLKGVDGELSIKNTPFICVPETSDNTAGVSMETGATTQGSTENDNEGGDYPIEDFLPDSES